MKANELRLGNKFECMGMVQTVFEIYDNTKRGKFDQAGYEHLITCIENGNQYKPIEINPIPLTEDWLLKFGFEKTTHNWRKGGYFVEKLFNKYMLRKIIKNPRSAFLAEIDFVHQLQNLYFALTGEELTIK